MGNPLDGKGLFCWRSCMWLLNHSSAEFDTPNELNLTKRLAWSILSKLGQVQKNHTCQHLLVHRYYKLVCRHNVQCISWMLSYIPTLMFSQTFLFFMYAMNWFRAARSRIFDIAGSKETGRLLFADSRSPSFESGTTSSDNFQEAGNTEDNNEWFTMSVNAGNMYDKACLLTAIGTLS